MLDGVDGQSHARPLYPRKRRGTHCIGGWVGEEYLGGTGIRFPDRRARSEWLCRLSYSGPLISGQGKVVPVHDMTS